MRTVKQYDIWKDKTPSEVCVVCAGIQHLQSCSFSKNGEVSHMCVNYKRSVNSIFTGKKCP
jgi:hypothetical protein